jgi:IS5 family transposase
MILDCILAKGNPLDSGTFLELMKRQGQLFERVPRQVSGDGGFASRQNLAGAKQMGIKDVSFSKRKGISVLEMVKSTGVYKALRNFRAGIEANISRLKKAFGFSRCDWTGWEGFKQYLWSALLTYNLTVMARSRM